jgi:hypothetical protein
MFAPKKSKVAQVNLRRALHGRFVSEKHFTRACLKIDGRG